MSNQILKIPSWFLTLMIVIGALGALLTGVALMVEGARELRDLAEHSHGIEITGDFLSCLAEAVMFSLIAIKLTRLRISKPSAILFWVLAGSSVVSLFWEDFGWIALLIMIVTAILCFGNSDTKRIGLWIICYVICAIIAGIFIESVGFSGKGISKFIIFLVTIPVIGMLEACKKFLELEVYSADTDPESQVEQSAYSKEETILPESVSSVPDNNESISNLSDAVSDSTNGTISFFKAYFINQYILRYVDFKGYTSRKSFWLAYVATLILSIGLCGLILLLGSFGMGGTICGSIVSGLVGLGLIVPGLALCVRRLRDAGKNPILILLCLIPLVGSIIVLVFLCQPSKFEEREEEGHWGMSDWIVTGVCALLMIIGIVLFGNSFNSGSSYDLGKYGYTEYAMEDENDAVEVGEVYVDGNEYKDSDMKSSDYGSVQSLEDLAENLDPEYFTYQLETYRMGSDTRMAQLFSETGSTNVPIEGTGVIGNHNISMEGWITEDGTIHGRYHNENGINLDFNGFIRRDNSLYIQLGHDGEKSDWILTPVASECPSGYVRYEGKWGKSQKESYVVFSTT